MKTMKSFVAVLLLITPLMASAGTAEATGTTQVGSVGEREILNAFGQRPECVEQSKKAIVKKYGKKYNFSVKDVKFYQSVPLGDGIDSMEINSFLVRKEDEEAKVPGGFFKVEFILDDGCAVHSLEQINL